MKVKTAKRLINDALTNNKKRKYDLLFTGVLQIVFIALKLFKAVNWHWPIILIPLEKEAIRLLIIFVYDMYLTLQNK